jgi:hypothetical protein
MNNTTLYNNFLIKEKTTSEVPYPYQVAKPMKLTPLDYLPMIPVESVKKAPPPKTKGVLTNMDNFYVVGSEYQYVSSHDAK